MPQVIPFALSAIASYAGASTLIVGAISIVGSLALSSYQQSKQERAQKQQYDSSQTDRLANVPATSAPRELVLGRVVKGGNVFYRGSAGQFKQLFAMCITLAAHEIDGVEQIFFNGVPMDLDVDGFVTTAPWGGLSRSAHLSTRRPRQRPWHTHLLPRR